MQQSLACSSCSSGGSRCSSVCHSREHRWLALVASTQCELRVCRMCELWGHSYAPLPRLQRIPWRALGPRQRTAGAGHCRVATRAMPSAGVGVGLSRKTPTKAMPSGAMGVGWALRLQPGRAAGMWLQHQDLFVTWALPSKAIGPNLHPSVSGKWDIENQRLFWSLRIWCLLCWILHLVGICPPHPPTPPRAVHWIHSLVYTRTEL
jgi:hypothetical protein